MHLMYRLGAKKDPRDTRDYIMTKAAAAAAVPTSVDYTRQMTAVGSQGAEGTCVGWACADGLKEYQEKKQRGRAVNLSPRYVYQRSKELDGHPDVEGTWLRVAMKVLNQKGVCPEDLWPYVPGEPGAPEPDADDAAYKYRIVSYARLYTLAEIKKSLASNGPLAMSVEVYTSFFDAPNGVIPMPSKSDSLEGGHAICIAGYDDAKRRVKFKNSWGPKWGDDGYGYLSYDYVEKYMMDSWAGVDYVGDGGDYKKPCLWDRVVAFFRQLRWHLPF